MATMVPPQKGVEYIFYTGLISQADTKLLQNNPTLAAGDVLVSTDGGATSNLDTLPAVTPASSDIVKVTVSATEMNGDNIIIVFSDAAGSEWCDKLINIQTAAQSLDTMDTNIDDIETDTNELQGLISASKLPAQVKGIDDIDLSATMKASVNTEIDTALSDINLDHLCKTATAAADMTTEVADNTILSRLLSNGDTSVFDPSTDGLQPIRDRGDAAWTTGGGGSISDILNVQLLVPNSIDLADTATVRISLGLTNMLDDLPSTAEITPGTITIDRKPMGGTSWTNVVNAAACSEAAGLVYYDEVFDSGTGYQEGDSIRITFKSQKITVSANDYEITGTDGWICQTHIRQVEKATLKM